MNFSTVEVAFLASATFLILVHGWVVVARVVRREGSDLGLRRRLGSLVREVCQEFRGERAEDPIGECMATKVSELAIDKTRDLTFYCGIVATFVCGMVMTNILDSTERMMSDLQILSLVVFYGICAAANLCPSMVSSRTLGLWQVVLLSNLTFMVVTADSRLGITRFEGISFLWRIAVSSAFLSFRILIAWNIAHVTICCSVYVYITPVDPEALSVWLFASFAIISATAHVGFSVMWHGMRLANLREDMEIAARTSESGAIATLLNTICDVVVELSSDLVIDEVSPRFETLMMLDPNQTSKGMKLQEFMTTDEDKHLFEDRLLSSSMGMAPLAGALHVQVRDRRGSTIGVQVFHVQFKGIADTTRYLIGIREFVDPTKPVARTPGTGARLIDRHASDLRAANGTPSTNRSSSLGSHEAPGEGPAGEGPPARAARRGSRFGNTSFPSSQSSRAQNVTLVIPQGCATTDFAKEASLLEALSLWNVQAPRVYCCPFHLATLEAERSVRKLKRKPCCKDFIGAVSGQCERCGALAEVDHKDPAGGYCHLCGTVTLKSLKEVLAL